MQLYPIVRTADFLIQNPKHLFAVARMVAGEGRYLGSPSIALYITYPIGSREYNLIAHFDRKVSFVRVGALYDNSPHRVFNRSTETSSKGTALGHFIGGFRLVCLFVEQVLDLLCRNA